MNLDKAKSEYIMQTKTVTEAFKKLNADASYARVYSNILTTKSLKRIKLYGCNLVDDAAKMMKELGAVEVKAVKRARYTHPSVTGYFAVETNAEMIN